MEEPPSFIRLGLANKLFYESSSGSKGKKYVVPNYVEDGLEKIADSCEPTFPNIEEFVQSLLEEKEEYQLTGLSNLLRKKGFLRASSTQSM